MGIIKTLYGLIIFSVFASACKTEYRPSVQSPATGYLVVEGFINSDGPTSITLSRTIKVYGDSVKDIFEHNALVNIESEYNESFPLYESGDGIYTSSSLQLNPNEKYRLKIKTSNGKEYASNFSDYRTTPDFDSLSWTRNSEGIKIYINTHDDQNPQGYYNWKYEETWEFHSRFLSSLQWIFDSRGVPIGVGYKFNDESNDTSIYKCWKTVKSSNIIIASTEKLSQE